MINWRKIWVWFCTQVWMQQHTESTTLLFVFRQARVLIYTFSLKDSIRKCRSTGFRDLVRIRPDEKIRMHDFLKYFLLAEQKMWNILVCIKEEISRVTLAIGDLCFDLKAQTTSSTKTPMFLSQMELFPCCNDSKSSGSVQALTWILTMSSWHTGTVTHVKRESQTTSARLPHQTTLLGYPHPWNLQSITRGMTFLYHTSA